MNKKYTRKSYNTISEYKHQIISQMVVATVCSIIFAIVGVVASILLEYFFVAKKCGINILETAFFSIPRDIVIFVNIVSFAAFDNSNKDIVYIIPTIMIITISFLYVFYSRQMERYNKDRELIELYFGSKFDSFEKINDALSIKKAMVDKISFETECRFIKEITKDIVYPPKQLYTPKTPLGFNFDEKRVIKQPLYKNNFYFLEVHYKFKLSEGSTTFRELARFKEQKRAQFEEMRNERHRKDYLDITHIVFLRTWFKSWKEYRINVPINPNVKVFMFHTFSEERLEKIRKGLTFIDKLKWFFLIGLFEEKYVKIHPLVRHIVIPFTLVDADDAQHNEDVKMSFTIEDLIQEQELEENQKEPECDINPYQRPLPQAPQETTEEKTDGRELWLFRSNWDEYRNTNKIGKLNMTNINDGFQRWYNEYDGDCVYHKDSKDPNNIDFIRILRTSVIRPLHDEDYIKYHRDDNEIEIYGY